MRITIAKVVLSSSHYNRLARSHIIPVRADIKRSLTLRYLSQSSSFTSNNMGPTRRIHACLTCLGEGTVKNKKKLSKKRQWEEKKTLETTKSAYIPPTLLDKCPTCGGSGVVVVGAESSSSFGMRVPPDFHVAIIGSGIGGLALALACSHRNIPHTIYERDCSFHERAQGYGLTMQQGNKALQALGITATTNRRTVERGGGEDMESPLQLPLTVGLHSKRHLVHTPEGQVVGEWGYLKWGPRKGQKEETSKRQNAHVSRQELRRLLYDAWVALGGTCSTENNTHTNLNHVSYENPKRAIQWGYKFIQYQEDDTDHDHVSLVFQKRDGNKDTAGYTKTVVEKASVIVGADGIRSSIRQQKMGDGSTPLRYLGCIVILGIAASPSCSTLTSDNETVFQTADGTTRLYVMPFSEKGKETAQAVRLWKEENDMNRKSVPTMSTMTHVVDWTIGEEKSGETMWQLSFPLSEEDAIRLSRSGPRSLKHEALRRCGTWHVPIPTLIHQTPEALISGYPVYDRSLLTETYLRGGKSNSIQSRRVTLVGDAAHPMSPFKGKISCFQV